ncbi:hypothetical protein [Nocardia gamkensis]|uniref:Uncharacterized protein n=1 Tax=Nocardia gamkensis TaxID=352869 RepID=A0A7X6R1T1_9NOCA|nr:hypothetical protein [Nocardia gamkensis]NKY25615.1 hypothetical protein [Nocardia gamkensis]NQE69621.1 Caldesmon [Nocardia gamkensis]
MDGYDRDRDKVPSHERGRIFENGIDRFFRDRENGYAPGSRIYETTKGRIRVDHSKEVGARTFTIEDKSGRIEGNKDKKQLEAMREILKENPNHQHMLRSVEGEPVAKDLQKLIDGLIRDFSSQFQHKLISRSDAREIWARGLVVERGKAQQLELQGIREKARQGKVQALQNRREKIAELARARERAEKFRIMLRFRDGATRGRAEAPERDRQAREEAERTRQARGVDERARVEREAAERVAQEFPAPNKREERPAADTGERAAREAAEARAAAENERAAAEKERAEHLARLQARGIPPEVVKILGLGQAEPPSAAVREPLGHAPPVVRGYLHSQDRSRGIERNR